MQSVFQYFILATVQCYKIQVFHFKVNIFTNGHGCSFVTNKVDIHGYCTLKVWLPLYFRKGVAWNWISFGGPRHSNFENPWAIWFFGHCSRCVRSAYWFQVSSIMESSIEVILGSLKS